MRIVSKKVGSGYFSFFLEIEYRSVCFVVLAQSSLERDLNLWEAGDLTEVGEKGLTLRCVGMPLCINNL